MKPDLATVYRWQSQEAFQIEQALHLPQVTPLPHGGLHVHTHEHLLWGRILEDIGGDASISPSSTSRGLWSASGLTRAGPALPEAVCPSHVIVESVDLAPPEKEIPGPWLLGLMGRRQSWCCMKFGCRSWASPTPRPWRTKPALSSGHFRGNRQDG
nr:uncharacterized protein LOC129526892 [Gorilla gorilla gorilla]